MDLSRYIPIVREVEALVVEATTLKMAGPRLEIAHRYCRDGICRPGEEIAGAALIHRGRTYPLRLSPSQCLLIEALARNSRFALNASQLEAYMRTDVFFRKHARNRGGAAFQRGNSRKVIKVNIQRIRRSFDAVLAAANVPLTGADILITERNEGVLGYRLRAAVQTVHVAIEGDAADAAVVRHWFSFERASPL
jgi:hypothetical protein